MPNRNRRAYLDAQHRITIKQEGIPVPGECEVIVKIEANGICGSDIHFYRDGRLGNFVVTVPYIPGHEASGIIIDKGKDVKALSVGDHVVIEPGIACGKCGYCKTGRYNLCPDVVFLSAPPINGTFCDYIAVRSDFIHKIPSGLSFEGAALIEPVAVAVHAVNRSRFKNGDTAVVVGAGPIGILTMQAFKVSGGAKTILIDINEDRLKIAKESGADEIINITENKDDLSNIADIAFETAGSSKATEMLFSLVRTGGSVVQVGWPEGSIALMNIADFIDKELDYFAVNRYVNAFPTAISWVADNRIKIDKLITNRYSFDQVSEAFEYTAKHPGGVMKTIVLN